MATKDYEDRHPLTLRFGRNILADERSEHPVDTEPQPLFPSMIHALTVGEEESRLRRKANEWKGYAYDDHAEICLALTNAAKAASDTLERQGEMLRSASIAGEYYTRHLLLEAGAQLNHLRREQPTLVKFLVEPPVATEAAFIAYLEWITEFFAQPLSAPTP